MVYDIFKLVFSEVLVYMAAGAVLLQTGLLNPQRNRFILEKIIFLVLFPLFIFTNVVSNISASSYSQLGLLIIWSALMIFTALLVARLLLGLIRLPAELKNGFLTAASFHNYGFLVYPLVLARLGEAAMPRAFAFAVTGDFLFWTLGVFLISRGNSSDRGEQKEKVNKIFTIARKVLNPPALAFGAALLAAPFWPEEYRPPAQMQTLTRLVIPLALVVIGAVLYDSLLVLRTMGRPGRANLQAAGWLLVLRTLILPQVMYLLYLLSGLNDEVFLIEAMMPASIGINLLAALFNGPRAVIGIFSLVSNLLAALTVPLYWWLYIA